MLDLKPRGIVILIGTNDLAGGAGPAVIASNIAEIIDIIRGELGRVPIVLCRVMPRSFKPGFFPDRIRALNALIDRIPQRRSSVVLCDTWTSFAAPDGNCLPNLFPDGLHPGPEGYERWRQVLGLALVRARLAGLVDTAPYCCGADHT